MKLFSKIASVAAALALVAGAGAVLASKKGVNDVKAEDVTHSVTLSNGTHDGSAITWTLDDLITIKQTKGTSSTPVNSSYIAAPRVYKGHILSFEAASNYVIKGISITVNGTYYGNSMTVGKVVSSNVVTDDSSISRTWTSTSGGKHEISSTDGEQNIYLQNVATTNVQLRFTALSITYGPNESSNPEISLNHSSLEFLSNGASQTITVTPNDKFTGTPTLSVSGTPSYVNVGVSGLVLTVSPKAVGTEDVTINAVHNTEQASAKFTVTVIDAHGHCADDPFTVAEIIALIDEDQSKTHQSVYVSGIISQIDSYSSTYQSITYWISDDGSTTTQFQAYGGLGIDSAKFSSVDDIEVGASVVLCGNAKYYSSKSIYEYDANNYQVSYSAPAKTLTEITLDTASVKKDFVVGEEFTYENLVVTAHYEGGDSAVVTPTSVSTPDMSTAGNKKIMVSYTENETTVTATYDINVAADSFTVSFDANGGSGTMDPVENIPAGSDYTLPTECTFTAPGGMTFDCWVDSDDFEIAVIEGIDDDVTVYASWKNLWTVSFNANGGSGSQDPLQVGDGESCLLPECTFTAPEGKAFDHWEVGGVEKTSLENVTSNVEVTATWKDAPSETVVTTLVSEYASANSWENGTQYSTMNMDSNITLTVAGGANSGKYYLGNQSWRLYSSEHATLTIDVGSTNSLISASLTFLNTDSPTVQYSGSDITSGATISLSGSSAVFNVTAGKAHFTSFTVTYDAGVIPPTPTTHTITYNANGGTGEMSPTVGETPAVVACTFTREGYEFDRWNDAADGSGKDYSVGETVSADITLYAQWNESGGGETTAARCYTLVESESQLVAGAKYIITGPVDAEKGFYALSTNQKSSNRGTTAITNDSGTAVVDSSEVEVITLGGSTGAWNLGVTGGYLYAASSSGNQLKTEASIDGNGNANWAITFSDGVTSIVAQGTNSRNVMQYNYNSGTPLVSCYGSASQTAVSLYRLDFEATLLHNVTCDGSSHSMPEGYTWNEDLKAVFNDLPESERLAMATAEAAADSGLERYDFIVGKYNPTGS